MNHEEFVVMVERLKANTKKFSKIEVETAEDGVDRVVFTFTYVSLQQLSEMTKTLRVARFPDEFPDGTPLPAMMVGKITVCELKKCPTCKHEEWKNITADIGVIMHGGVPRNW